MNGLILIDKPAECTSHDVVLALRRTLSEQRIGHFGTLDPMATGLLVAAMGKAARFFRFFSNETKTYLGRIRLGLATDTFDAQGKPLSAECTELPDEQALRKAMAGTLGKIQQVPPPYSAKKIKGQPFYKLARAGKETPKTPSTVVIHRFDLIRYDPPEADVEVVCSSGTYVRSLAHDLGRDLGCGGHLTRLRRTASGRYSIDQALSLEQIQDLAAAGETDRFLIPLEDLLPDRPLVVLNDSERLIIRNGQALSEVRPTVAADSGLGPSRPDGSIRTVVRLVDSQGRLIALAYRDDEMALLRPFLVID